MNTPTFVLVFVKLHELNVGSSTYTCIVWF